MFHEIASTRSSITSGIEVENSPSMSAQDFTDVITGVGEDQKNLNLSRSDLCLVLFVHFRAAIGDEDDFAEVVFCGVFDHAIEVGPAGGSDAALEDVFQGSLDHLIAEEIDRLADQVEETWL